MMNRDTKELPACTGCGATLHPISKYYGICPIGAGAEKGFCTEGRLIQWTKKDFERTRRALWMASFPSATNISSKLYRIERLEGVWEKHGKSLRVMQRPEPEKMILRPGQEPRPRPEEAFASVGVENKVYRFRRPAKEVSHEV